MKPNHLIYCVPSFFNCLTTFWKSLQYMIPSLFLYFCNLCTLNHTFPCCFIIFMNWVQSFNTQCQNCLLVFKQFNTLNVQCFKLLYIVNIMDFIIILRQLRKYSMLSYFLLTISLCFYISISLLFKQFFMYYIVFLSLPLVNKIQIFWLIYK